MPRQEFRWRLATGANGTYSVYFGSKPHAPSFAMKSSVEPCGKGRKYCSRDEIVSNLKYDHGHFWEVQSWFPNQGGRAEVFSENLKAPSRIRQEWGRRLWTQWSNRCDLQGVPCHSDAEILANTMSLWWQIFCKPVYVIPATRQEKINDSKRKEKLHMPLCMRPCSLIPLFGVRRHEWINSSMVCHSASPFSSHETHLLRPVASTNLSLQALVQGRWVSIFLLQEPEVLLRHFHLLIQKHTRTFCVVVTDSVGTAMTKRHWLSGL